MGRKVFQIAFVLLVLAAFGTVFNHYLKNKISKPEDYLNYIESFPQNRISVIDPIIIKIPKDFDRSEYKLNTPINDEIIQFIPEVNGTLYWSDKQTLEFYPDNPLKSNSEYLIRVNIDKIFTLKKKIRFFNFALRTYKQELYVNAEAFEAEDSTLRKQKLAGNLVFNDFIDFDILNSIIKVNQKGKALPVSFIPGKLEGTFHFQISDITRGEKQDTLNISWNSTELDFAGSKEIIVPSLTSFQIKDINYLKDSVNKLLIAFSDPLKKNQAIDSLIKINGKNASNVKLNNKEVEVIITDSMAASILLSVNKNIQSIIGVSLPDSIYRILHAENDKPSLRIIDSTYIVSDFGDHFHWEFEAKNLSSVDVQIYKIFENNVLQFLQTNSIQGIEQINRVGSVVFDKTIELSNQVQYKSNAWVKYQLNINEFEPEQGCIYSVLVGHKNDSIKKPNSQNFFEYREGIHYNLYFTNLKILAKQISKDSLYIWVNNIITSEPLKNVEIDVLNFQRQVITRGSTNDNGLLKLELSQQPVFILAKQNGITTYQKLQDYNCSLRMNNVFFMKTKKNWEPGENINVTFMHNMHIKPKENSKVVFNLYTPDKKKIFSDQKLTSKTGAYVFSYPIPNGAKIGNYLAEIVIDNNIYTHEYSVLPPLLKNLKASVINSNINNDFFEYEIEIENLELFTGEFKYEFTVFTDYLSPQKKEFKSYSFGLENLKKEKKSVIGILNEQGKAVIKIPVNPNFKCAQVKHEIAIRIFQGNFGFTELNKAFTHNLVEPEIIYQINNNVSADNIFKCDSLITFDFLLLNKNLSVNKSKFINTELRLYKLNEYDREQIKYEKLKFAKGKLKWETKFGLFNDGDYTIELLVPKLNLKLEIPIKIVKPNYLADKEEDIFINLFSLSSDTINVKDSIELMINSLKRGKALITIFNHNGNCFNHWFDLNQGKNILKINSTEQMFPKAELAAYLYYSNEEIKSSRKIIAFKNITSNIQPIIFSKHEIEPESNFSISVKDKNGLAMQYVIAVSSLNKKSDITALEYIRFRNAVFDFFHTNSYGLSTSITNNYIASSQNKNETIEIGDSPFKGFDFHLGPFDMGKGENKVHNIYIPQYIGDFKIEIVASDLKKEFYKNTSKIVSVKKPYVIITEQPNQISPSEQFNLPVNIYSSFKDKRKVNVHLKKNVDIEVLNSLEQEMYVNNLKADTGVFNLKSKRRTGIGQIEITAKDSSFTELKEVTIPIKSNAVLINKWDLKSIPAGETWKTRFTPVGVKGTNYATIEFSYNTNIHLSQLIKVLVGNKHADIDHLISSTLPLLFLNELTHVENSKAINQKIQSGLDQLIFYQLPTGGFSFWKNNEETHKWSSSLVGLFMIEATKKGFEVNQAVYTKWLRYQRRECLTWNNTANNGDLVQAFGLYTLVLANRPDINSMRKLMSKPLTKTSTSVLALAFNLLGEQKQVNSLFKENYESFIYKSDLTNGNPLRNMAIELFATMQIKNFKNQNSLKTELEALLVNPDYQSTQAISFSLLALSKYFQQNSKNTTYEIIYRVNRGKEQKQISNKPYGIVKLPLDFTLTKNIDITNVNNEVLNVCLDYSGRPYSLAKEKLNNFISVTSKFVDTYGKVINPKALNYSSQINSNVTVNPIKDDLYTNIMVLEFPMSNCFDILNTSAFNKNDLLFTNQIGNTIYYYFKLPKNGISFEIPLVVKHKGVFKQFPAKVYSLYNPMIKAITKDEIFTVF